MRGRAIELAAAWLLRWTLLVALWLALTDSARHAELAAGAVAAALGATLATALAPRPPVLPRRLRLAAIAGALGRLVLDTGLLARAVWTRITGKRVRSSFRAVRFRHAADRRGRATVALAESLGSVRPNRYVIAVDSDRKLLLLHELRRDDGPLDPLGR
jgi:multisubunit Na+/H+ antiporter MnhE subunit